MTSSSSLCGTPREDAKERESAISALVLRWARRPASTSAVGNLVAMARVGAVSARFRAAQGKEGDGRFCGGGAGWLLSVREMEEGKGRDNGSGT